MQDICLDLTALKATHLDQVGAKAVNLSVMSKLGYTIPSGICLLAQAYMDHINQHGISIQIPDALANQPDAVRERLEGVRTAIRTASLSPEVRTAIQNTLHGQVVAVRSSATAEDLPDASFAGQYDTVLNVTSLDQCVEAVKQCWASLWTARAYYYRMERGIEHCQVRMAVIIQDQVHADVSGVAFSVDPVTGSRLRIVVEACQGLGEALVSGQVTPERWIWRKPRIQLLGKAEVDVPVLTLRIAKRIARQVKRLEAKFDMPLDIEWAIQDNKLYWLQARPVTTMPPLRTWEERQIWTNFNTGEVVPDVLTPATWSVLEHKLVPLFQSIFALVGADITKAPVMGLVAGKAYFNLNTLLSAGYPFWLVTGRDPEVVNGLTEALGGHQGDLDVDLPEDELSDLGFTWGKYIRSIPNTLWTIFKKRPSKTTQLLEDFNRRINELRQIDVHALSTESLAQAIHDSVANELQHWDLLFLVTSGLCLPVLEKICTNWLKEEEPGLMFKLFTAQGNMADTQAGLDLWELAMKVKQAPNTERLVQSGDPWEEIEAELDSDFIQAWQAFIQEHGHHGRGELELINPRWCEQPDYVLNLVRGYLTASEQIDPIARYHNLIEDRERVKARCCQKLRNPMKRWLFKWAVSRAAKLAGDRENWKNEAVCWMAILRTWMLELGRKFYEQGLIECEEDIFFLRFDELEPVAYKQAEFDVHQRIQERRTDYAWNQAQNPMPVVIGPFDPDKHTMHPISEKMHELKGLAVSPGIVTGPARVILRADEHETVLPGEILVAPFTDPAWTPYFVPAAGVVMDLGGALSHGSIIAREYGLPAVVNVRSATQVIQTGQLLEVNGTMGTVRLIDP